MVKDDPWRKTPPALEERRKEERRRGATLNTLKAQLLEVGVDLTGARHVERLKAMVQIARESKDAPGWLGNVFREFLTLVDERTPERSEVRELFKC